MQPRHGPSAIAAAGLMLRGGAALGMAAFGDLLDDLGGEGVEVAGVTPGDEALIDHHRGIFRR